MRVSSAQGTPAHASARQRTRQQAGGVALVGDIRNAPREEPAGGPQVRRGDECHHHRSPRGDEQQRRRQELPPRLPPGADCNAVARLYMMRTRAR